MAWSEFWPIQSGDTIENYDVLFELWDALRERNAAINGGFEWPGGQAGYGGGTIASITDPGDGTLHISDPTVADGTGEQGWICDDGTHRWAQGFSGGCGVANSSLEWMPKTY